MLATYSIYLSALNSWLPFCYNSKISSIPTIENLSAYFSVTCRSTSLQIGI
ncbi:hypothetical protein CROQUDRAFT_55056 [Cronartium quercuum f. sp. fusiforme G11]|uniref:Uncharacterized protein n=1 Tax=Cronartium quercuum f. sp. fusiforme G11 TaxID=708437 RepID=A0A9P6N515_9BASI|nr:hypothetical protein CROQUDRAFT_55056 [Cronartium quercuum f. sp. fusiforme G11]